MRVRTDLSISGVPVPPPLICVNRRKSAVKCLFPELGSLCAFAARPVEYLLDRKYIGFAVEF